MTEKKKKAVKEEEAGDTNYDEYVSEEEKLREEYEKSQEAYDESMVQQYEENREEQVEEFIDELFNPDESDEEGDTSAFDLMSLEGLEERDKVIKEIAEALRIKDKKKRYAALKNIRNRLDGILSEEEQKKSIIEKLTNIGAQRCFAEIEKNYFNDWKEDFIINGVIPRNGLTVVAGQSGGGKSWVAYEMMVSLLTKDKFLGKFEVNKSNVLYFDLENDASTSRKRLFKLTRFADTDVLKQMTGHGRLINVLYTQQMTMNEFEEQIKTLRERLDKNDTGRKNLVVFVDVLKRLFIFDENDAGETNRHLTPLKQMCQKYNVSIVIVHHTKKTNDYKERFDLFSSMRGSSEIYNIADSVIGVIAGKLTRIDGEKINRVVKDLIFFQTKLRRAIDFGQLNVQMVENIDKEYAIEDIEFKIIKKEDVDEIRNEILECLEKTPTSFVQMSELQAKIKANGNNYTDREVRVAMQSLIDEKKVCFEGKTRCKKYKIVKTLDGQETLENHEWD